MRLERGLSLVWSSRESRMLRVFVSLTFRDFCTNRRSPHAAPLLDRFSKLNRNKAFQPIWHFLALISAQPLTKKCQASRYKHFYQVDSSSRHFSAWRNIDLMRGSSFQKGIWDDSQSVKARSCIAGRPKDADR